MEMYRKDPRLCRTRTMRILVSVATSYQVSIFEACTESFSHENRSPESESSTQQELIMITPSSNSSPDTEYQTNVPQSLASIVYNPAFNSTRPEDMWNFSLSTVDMRKSNMMDKPKTPESYQQNDDEMKSSISTMENIHQPEGPGDRYPNIEPQQLISENMNTDELNNLFTMTDNLVQQQLNISSLKSDIPLWDVPSATTWNEWEMFIKHNMS
ncbi:hypothetical protein RMCBS344292_16615 [Rhizopus microsporus]|nr:hypothetical protein RMCBS344292_16615 [Rhizopus microsporus]